MKNNDFYACFGGFGPQYWTNLVEPNIEGKCHELTICRVDGETGKMQVHSQAEGIENPSTLVVSPDQKFIYAGNEDHDFKGRGFGGGLSAFAFDMETGTAKLINQSLAYGASTAYITLDRTGSYIFVANHGSKYYCSRYENIDGVLTPKVIRDEGCVCVFKVREDGGIGELTDRLVLTGTGIDEIEHASAHPHSVVIDEDDFVVIPNKGGDNIYVCKFNRDTQKMDLLSIFQSELGSSPRHACFVPGTDYVLIQNEYDGHLCSYELDRKKGELTRISRIDTWIPELTSRFSLMKKQLHPWGTDVQLHPGGKFVFNNNTQGVIGSFELNYSTGHLTLLHRYVLDDIIMSRGMQVDRSGRFLVVTGVLNEKALVLSINQETGELSPVTEVLLPTPTALRFLYP